MYALFVVLGLFCLGLTTTGQVSAADKVSPDSGKEYRIPLQSSGGPAAWHAEKERAYMRRHYHIRQAFKQLNLTDSQKTAIHDIRIALRKNMIQSRADLKIAKIELAEQIRKDTVDMATVETQVKKIEGLRTAMRLDAIKARVAIKSKLTPEQRKKLAELMQNS